MTVVADPPAQKQKSKGNAPNSPETVARTFAYETIQSVAQAIGWLQARDKDSVDQAYNQCGVAAGDAVDLAGIRPVVEKVKLWELTGKAPVTIEQAAEAIVETNPEEPVAETQAQSSPGVDQLRNTFATEGGGGGAADADGTTSPGEKVAQDAGLTQADEKWLHIRPDVEAARQMVAIARQELCDKEGEYDKAKKARDGAKTALEAAWLRLEAAVSGQLEPAKLPLYETNWDTADKPAAVPADPADAEAVRAWERKWEEFLDTPITKLDVSEGIQEKLASHSSPIRNLRELTALTSDVYRPEGYQQVNGIGQGKADQIQAAYDKLMEAFLAENPRPRSMQAPGAEQSQPADRVADPAWDFESVFPPLINPSSPNETINDDEHRIIVKDTIEGQQEVTSLETCLKDGVDKSGKTLTDKKRQKLETDLGEAKSLHDDGYATYRERFGEAAEKALRKYVEGKIDRNSKLKGGLE